MKRAMSFFVAVGILLFSQLALAEVEFQVGEFTVTLRGEVPDEGPADEQLAAAGFKVVPLQAYTYSAAGALRAWWQLEEDFYCQVPLSISGSGEYYVIFKITDLKTGESDKIKFFNYGDDGFGYWTLGPLAVSDGPMPLPRKWKFTCIFKVGTIKKRVSTKIILY